METGTTKNLWKSFGMAEQLATMKAEYSLRKGTRFTKCMCMSRSQRNRFLLTTTSGVPVATAEGAELLGITADKLVMACRRGAL